MSRIPVLTYHSMNIAGNDYLGNDHVAFAADLRLVTRRGFRVAPLHEVVSAWTRDRGAYEGERVVALSCDDGPDFDFHDLPHPVAGVQRSMLNLIADFAREQPGAQPALHLTAFVIASPEARRILDQTCMIGKGWWNDDWWPAAVAGGRLGIANHSWDHNHPSLPGELLPGIARGSFARIDTLSAADAEIRRAAEFIARHAPGPSNALFAYPNGESNDYLVREYFPRHAGELGIDAAFTITPGYIDRGSDPWRLPRFTCGDDWRSPEDLDRILDGAA